MQPTQLLMDFGGFLPEGGIKPAQTVAPAPAPPAPAPAPASSPAPAPALAPALTPASAPVNVCTYFQLFTSHNQSHLGLFTPWEGDVCLQTECPDVIKPQETK